ncbi:FkbM family methyltransferase [Psychroserpens sp. XS_ASV72]|uniref:FkbM family methyltransferase n=1 Tax=Psychroserpens sp. XS_ASV72 TaxID=3241293 RepID=UPI003517570B
MSVKNILKQIYNKVNRLFLSSFDKQLLKLKSQKEGQIDVKGFPFYVHHGRAFYDTYNEIFIDKIYDFKTDSQEPIIIDCGANMGLSLVYFKSIYPKAKILAFEPDESVLPFLEKNIKSQQLSGVVLYKNAVWKSDEELTFYTDSGMGGRVGVSYDNQEPVKIKALRLRTFLEQPVDMLKIDIEGAEYVVLNDCKDVLGNVKNLFVEYHSEIGDEQHLDDILQILKQNGFRYHLKESFSRKKPFISRHILCERFDMAINIFAYRE